MAYRSWHRDGGRPPPPPYSKHKHSSGGTAGPAGATAATTSTLPGDSRFSADLFKDMSKKIAHLTKVVCSLSNKAEDQEQILKSARTEHEEKLKTFQSEWQQKTEAYKDKIRTLELQLQEEKRNILKKEEELKTLKQFRAFAENCRLFKEPLIRSSKDQTSISGDSDDIGKLRLEFDLERIPADLYFDSKLIFPPSEQLRNGGSEFTFIGNKLRDMESYEKEVRFLIDACERLKAEKMSLKTKCESDFHEIEEKNSQVTQEKEGMLFGPPSDGDRRLSELNLKEQLEKQDLQYRKKISELLQCLTQSEGRAEKYRKEIKQLEENLSSKDKQNSLMTGELSKTLEHLKQSRNANAEIQELCSKQSQEIQTKNDLIAKIEEERKNYETQLTSSKLEIQQLSDKLKESHKESAHLHQLLNSKEAESKELQLSRNELAIEQKKCEQLQKDFELRIKSIRDNHGEERRKLEERIESLMRSSLQQERVFLRQLEDTKMRYELHMDEERLVHREIQDNLEQQLDLLHRNVQHTIRNEEEEVATLHLLLGDKEASLNKTQKQLKEAREIADRMRRLIKLKEIELEKVREQQKIHHSTEVRFTVENSRLSSSETKQQSTIHEYPVIFNVSEIGEEKHKFLKGRIEFLEEQNNFLRKEKEERMKTHLLELEAQSEAHKKEIEKLRQDLLPSAQNGRAILGKLTEEHVGKKNPKELSIKGKHQDYSAEMEIESYRGKCSELREAMRKIEENSLSQKEEELRCDLSAERDQVRQLTSLVEALQAEHGRVVVEREAKMNEVLRVRSEASQQIKNLENYWQERLVRELKKATHSFENEKQKLLSHFSKGQRLLKDKIVLLQSIMKDLKDRKLKRESEEENMEAFQELHRTIAEKDATINKLKEEKKALHIELLNQRDDSVKAFSSQTLASSIENMFALKKPRLERPPLTPQLVRRHSLLGSSEQKWLRARSQSPVRGFQPECTSKSTFPSPPVHRSSWTGEISAELFEGASLQDDNDTKMTSKTESIDSTKDLAYATESLSHHKEQVLQIKSEEEKFPIPQHSRESLSNHICDTIAECDELLMTIEEEDKQSTVALKDEKLEVKDWAENQILESEV